MGRPKGLKDSVERIRSFDGDGDVMPIKKIANCLGISREVAAKSLRSGMKKLRENPELFAHVFELAAMRQGLRGEHRVIKSFSKGIEL